jgi:hypothetical protein
MEYTSPSIFLLDEHNRGIFHRFAMEQYTAVAISFVMSIINREMNRFAGNLTLEFQIFIKIRQ